MLGGILLVLTDLSLAFTRGSSDTYTGTSAEQIASVAFLVAKILILVGLVGLYLYQVEAAGAFGRVAFLLALVGTALMVSSDWSLGWFLFGLATFRARAFPRPVAALLIAGVLLPFTGLPWIFVVWNIAIAWMGLLVLSDKSSLAAGERVNTETLLPAR
jgi:hypothetical protein